MDEIVSWPAALVAPARIRDGAIVAVWNPSTEPLMRALLTGGPGPGIDRADALNGQRLYDPEFGDLADNPQRLIPVPFWRRMLAGSGEQSGAIASGILSRCPVPADDAAGPRPPERRPQRNLIPKRPPQLEPSPLLGCLGHPWRTSSVRKSNSTYSQ